MSDFSSADSNCPEVKPILGELISLVIKSRGSSFKDFMFCLEYFSEECIPYQSTDMINSGFASLKLKSFYDSHPLAKYVTDGYFVNSFSVRDTVL
jgi:hypothetical protein